MNYIVLSSYDSMVNNTVLLISDEKMSYTYLSEDEKNQLKSDNGCWFDIKKVKKYLRDNSLLPCNIINCTDGDADFIYVDKYSC